MPRLILALILCACATISTAKEKDSIKPINVPKDRVIQIVDVIGNDMFEKVFKLALMGLESKDPIYLMINSPGGYVVQGEIFMNAMAKLQSKGIVFKCVANEAASMAMYIFNACDQRYVVPTARLLWHPVKAFIQQPISSRLAHQLEVELTEIDDKFRIPLRDNLHADEESFEKYRWEEKFWSVAELMEYSPDYMVEVSAITGTEWEQPSNSPFNLIIKTSKAYLFYLGL